MRTLNDLMIYGRIADVSTAGQDYLPAPDAGRIHGLYATLSAAITSADAVLTVKTAAGTVGTLTITQSGSAPGSTFYTEFSPSATNYVNAGDYIEVETDGGSSTTSIATLAVVLRR